MVADCAFREILSISSIENCISVKKPYKIYNIGFIKEYSSKYPFLKYIMNLNLINLDIEKHYIGSIYYKSCLFCFFDMNGYEFKDKIIYTLPFEIINNKEGIIDSRIISLFKEFPELSKMKDQNRIFPVPDLAYTNKITNNNCEKECILDMYFGIFLDLKSGKHRIAFFEEESVIVNRILVKHLFNKYNTIYLPSISKIIVKNFDQCYLV
tara:strand:+ start:572 stop:1201 length:630 start_codon:yes stop_codon:yes gene_type:complete